MIGLSPHIVSDHPNWWTRPGVLPWTKMAPTVARHPVADSWCLVLGQNE